jgi:hypothetical protein
MCKDYTKLQSKSTRHAGCQTGFIVCGYAHYQMKSSYFSLVFVYPFTLQFDFPLHCIPSLADIDLDDKTVWIPGNIQL